MLKKVLLGLAALFVLVLLGGFLWVRSIVANDGVRTALAAQISKAIGQPVTIGGVGATLYPTTSVTLKDVAIGDRSPVTIRSLRVGTDFRALLSRRIEHASLHLDGAHVALPLPTLTLGTGNGSDASASGTAPASTSAPVEIVSIDEIVLSGVEIVSGGRILRGDVEVVPEGKGLFVRKVSLTAEKATLTATGRITDLAGPVGDLTIKAGALDFDQLIAFANDFSNAAGVSGGHATSAPDTPAQAPMPEAMNLTATIEAERATIGTLAIERVTAHALVKGNNISVEPLAFGLFDGRYEGTLSVALGTATPTFRWKATVADIDVAKATAFAGSPNTVSGRLSAKIDLIGKGADVATAMETVRGTARLDVTNGVVRNLGLVRSVGAATALSLEGLQHAAAGSKDVDEPFARLGATVLLADGRASTSDLRFDAADLSLSANGTLELDASALNLKGRLELSEALSQQVHQKMLRLSQEQGRVVLPATITGSVAAPIVRVDAADIAKRALRNTATQQAPGLIKKGLGGLIRK